MSDAVWNEVLDEFRTLGGIAENIRLGEGMLGRGLFPIDPAIPVRLHTPENLLIKVSDVVFENGVLRVSPSANVGARERKFFEDYHARISWGGGGRTEIETIFEQAQALPDALRRDLRTKYRCGSWFDEPVTSLIERAFIDSREFGYGDRDVMMPLIELANHGDACTYGCERGISIEGIVKDEVTVRYAETDTYGVFRSWGFDTGASLAFSIELEGTIDSARLLLERRTDGVQNGPSPWVPTLTANGEVFKLNFLMLGNNNYPRLCRGIFRRVVREAGFKDADETFDKIRRANFRHFLGLIEDLETVEGPMAQSLRRMARRQLQALSNCFGAREV